MVELVLSVRYVEIFYGGSENRKQNVFFHKWYRLGVMYTHVLLIALLTSYSMPDHYVRCNDEYAHMFY
jgi:hypothetical protein